MSTQATADAIGRIQIGPAKLRRGRLGPIATAPKELRGLEIP